MLWVYRAAGLPVQVVAETSEWRKICDPGGQVAWVHRAITTAAAACFNRTDAPLALHRRPSAEAGVRARLAPRAWSPWTDARTAGAGCSPAACTAGRRRGAVLGQAQAQCPPRPPLGAPSGADLRLLKVEPRPCVV